MNNWIIENDNLVVLKNLLPEYKGKIDVMPIDPPYNTDIDYIGYKDSNFANGWCAFMLPRLEAAYRLLSNRGIMFIHIDENELTNLLDICRKIFGAENVSILTWKKTDEHYDINRIEKPLEYGVRRTNEFIVTCYKDRKNITLKPILQPVWDGTKHIDVIKPLETVVDGFGTTSSAKDEIAELFGERTAFSTPKPVRLIRELIRAASEPNSVILDFFAGSGTTGHATLDLNAEDGGNRKFILVTNNENNIFRDATVPRIQKAIVKFGYKDTFKVKPLDGYKGIIGMRVDVTIDRPIGTEHPKYPGMFYPINYGYVQGILGGDDEEQDVYILGENIPLKKWSGKIIGVVHRLNDIEDKWIASSDDKTYTIAEIKAAVAFQERFYDDLFIIGDI